ncbi:hypothetical protein [Metamycoplasma equirhinis]|uniref:hypothetical protein n=1 Tax=Metamycoplasma equirhinis TaxID=92402 RepID=UPI0035946863
MSEKSQKIKKILKTIGMFLGVGIPLVCAVAIPLALNKKANIKRKKYFTDEKSNFEIKEETDSITKNKRLIIKQTNASGKEIMAENPREIREKNKNVANNGIKSTIDLKFFGDGHDFQKFVENALKLKEQKTKSIAQNLNEEVYHLDLLSVFDKFNEGKTGKDKKTIDSFIKSIDKLNISLTYFYKKDSNIYYYDIKENYFGYSTLYFFKKINEQIKAKNINNYEITKAQMNAFIKINQENQIESLTFDNIIEIEYK